MVGSSGTSSSHCCLWSQELSYPAGPGLQLAQRRKKERENDSLAS